MREIKKKKKKKNNGNNLLHMITAAFQDSDRLKSVLEMWLIRRCFYLAISLCNTKPTLP